LPIDEEHPMEVPADLRYTTDHEWARAENGKIRVGITDFAQDALGDIVFVDLPEAGTVVEGHGPLGEVESTKSVSQVYAAIGGTVVEVNTALADSPELINAEPYGKGWLVVIDPSDPSELESLLDADAYKATTQ
jgi:glycine cleavage system H protein